MTVDATPGNGRPDALAGAIPVYWRVWEKLQDTLSAVRNWVVTASWSQKGTVFALLVLGLLVPQVYRYYLRRRLAILGFRYSSPDAALSLLSDRFEALLTRRGVPCPENRTWTEHLEAVDLDNDRAVAGFVRSYERARFGLVPMPTDISRLEGMLSALEKQPIEKRALEKV